MICKRRFTSDCDASIGILVVLLLVSACNNEVTRTDKPVTTTPDTAIEDDQPIQNEPPKIELKLEISDTSYYAGRMDTYLLAKQRFDKSSCTRLDQDRFWGGLNLWKIERTNDEWGQPIVLGPEINTHHQVYPSIAANGNLYYTKMINDQSPAEVYLAVNKDGYYEPAEKLAIDFGISETELAFVGYIDPEERYLLYFTYDTTEILSQDIMISYNRGGQWTKGERLSEKVNTPDKDEVTPNISPDGQYLFFGRNETGGESLDIMQIDLSETGIDLNKIQYPYIAPDESSFFIRNSHTMILRLQISISVITRTDPALKDGVWEAPEKLGPEINMGWFYYRLSRC